MSDFESDKRHLNESVFGNIVLTVIELAIGILSQSTAVISLALHDFSDVISSLIARFAVGYAEKTPNSRMTYGYYRITVLAALFNALVLIGLTAWLFWEGIQRLLNPVHVDVGLVALVGIVSMTINGIIAYRLLKGSKDLNIRALFWHIADDFLGGIAVLLVGIITYFYDWHYADGIATIIVSLIVFKGIWGVIQEVIEVIMEATPRDIDSTKLEKTLRLIPSVKGVHDIHVWTLGSGIYCISLHVEMPDNTISQLSPTVLKVKKVLAEKFNIHHTTIEIECADCHIEHTFKKRKTTHGHAH